MQPTANPTGLGQIHISVTDLDASVRFYRDLIGLPLLFEVPGQHMAFLQCGATRLYLGRPESDEFRSRPVLYLTVDDIQASYAEMCRRGVEFIDEPHRVHATADGELWMAFTRDPDGNHVAIMADVAG